MPEALIVSVFVTIILLVSVVGMYNKFIKYKNQIQEAWSGIDIALKQRFNLIPNLVRTVKGYASYESATLEQTTNQRVSQGGVESRSEEESTISRSLNDLLAVAESYPDLKANHTFVELQKNLNAAEQGILEARQRYNSAVRKYNTHVESFPSNVMAKMFNFRTLDYFHISLATQRSLPEIGF